MTVANTATRAVVFSGIAFTLAMVGMLLVPDTTLRSLGLGAVRGRPGLRRGRADLPPGAADGARRPRRSPARALARATGGRVGRRPRAASGGARCSRSCAARRSASSPRPCSCWRSPRRCWTSTSAPPGTSSLPDGTVAKQGLIALQRDFPSGATDPVDIVVDGDPATPRPRQGLTRLRAALAADRDFAARALPPRSAARGSPCLGAADRRRAPSARRPRSTGCATTTSRPRSARPPTAC